MTIDRLFQLRKRQPRQTTQETVFLTVYLVDKMLETFPQPDNIELVTAAALRIASKYEDVFPVELDKA